VPGDSAQVLQPGSQRGSRILRFRATAGIAPVFERFIGVRLEQQVETALRTWQRQASSKAVVHRHAVVVETRHVGNAYQSASRQVAGIPGAEQSIEPIA